MWVDLAQTQTHTLKSFLEKTHLVPFKTGLLTKEEDTKDEPQS